eukprot:5279693-Pyramimonas_sp.AAC.1
MRGCDLDDPSLPRQPDGPIARPPIGGPGCPACADNVDMRSPPHDRDPRHCRWYDKDDYHWECPSCKKNYGKKSLGGHQHPANASMPSLGSCPRIMDRDH